MFVSAAVALHPQEPMFQSAAGEVVVELLGDESRQLGTVFGNMVQELRQVPLDDRIQRCFLGLVAPVANQVGGCIQTGPGVD